MPPNWHYSDVIGLAVVASCIWLMYTTVEMVETFDGRWTRKRVIIYLAVNLVPLAVLGAWLSLGARTVFESFLEAFLA